MSQRPDLSKLTSDEKDALIYALLARVEELERRLGAGQLEQRQAAVERGLQKETAPHEPAGKDGQEAWRAGRPRGQEPATGRKSRQGCRSLSSGLRRMRRGFGLEHATGHRKRQTFDLPNPQPVEVTEHRVHRCQCPRCGEETEAAFPAGVRAPAQYGPNLAALVVYLQHWHFIPEDRLAELMGEVFRVDVSAATIAAMAQRKAEEWTGLADHIGEQVKQAAVKHLDETGYRIAGLLHWLHVASTWLLTFYRTSRKRGAMPEGVEGIVVHDFWRPYFTMAGVAHALCNAHHLRELKALIDIEKEPWAVAMSRFLRHACHAANLARRRNERLKPAFLVWL